MRTGRRARRRGDMQAYIGDAIRCGLGEDAPVGLDRMAMLKYGMPDIRGFFEADLRWLKHYGFQALDIPTLDGGLSK